MESKSDQAARPAPRPPLRGHREQELEVDSGGTQATVVRLVGTGRRVLELGPGLGRTSRILRDAGCTIVSIERDPELAELAGQYCERVVVGELDELDLEAELGSDRFDVILAAGVLGQLQEPLETLRRLRTWLAPEGFFVLAPPNVAEENPSLGDAAGDVEHLQKTLAALAGREGQLRTALIDAHDQLYRRDEEICRLGDELGARDEEAARLQLELGHAQAELGAVREQVTRMRVRLERILSSAPARAYAKLRRLPGIRIAVARRTAGYDSAVRSATGAVDGPDA